MFVELPKDAMHNLAYGELLIAACDTLSAIGVANYIHWLDTVTASVNGELCTPVIDYSRCGIDFVACKSDEVV